MFSKSMHKIVLLVFLTLMALTLEHTMTLKSEYNHFFEWYAQNGCFSIFDLDDLDLDLGSYYDLEVRVLPFFEW